MKTAVALLLALMTVLAPLGAGIAEEAAPLAPAAQDGAAIAMPGEVTLVLAPAEDEGAPAEDEGAPTDPAQDAPADPAQGAPADPAQGEAADPAQGEAAEAEDEVPAPTVITIRKNKTKTVWLGAAYRLEVKGKKVLSFKSSAKKIATVNAAGEIKLKKTGTARITARLKGETKLKKTGTARITARLKGGKKVVLTLKVADPLVPASVTLVEGAKASIDLGDTLQLSARVSPATAPQDVTWTSSNPRVAVVDDTGLVVPMDWGKATVTAATPNKKKATFVVTVKKPATDAYIISHAMGGVDDRPYSNCLEGFLENYAEGHRIFEVDLEYTSDGRLVLCHDWDRDLFTGQKIGRAPTYAQFMGSKIFGKYTPMSIDDLLLLMHEYPDARVITDSKYPDTATVKKQFRTIVNDARTLGVEDVLDRFVVEIYNEKMLSTVRGIYPFREYIFTLYKRFKKAPSKSQLKSIASFCYKNGVGTIAMATGWWKPRTYPDILKKYSIDAALFSTNSASDAKKYFRQGVTALFSDFLPPLK